MLSPSRMRENSFDKLALKVGNFVVIAEVASCVQVKSSSALFLSASCLNAC